MKLLEKFALPSLLFDYDNYQFFNYVYFKAYAKSH